MNDSEFHTTRDEVSGRKPVTLSFGVGTLLPSRIQAAYCLENGSWQLSDVTVYGRRIDGGWPGAAHVKAVFWSNTLTNAAEWVQSYVAENLPSSP